MMKDAGVDCNDLDQNGNALVCHINPGSFNPLALLLHLKELMQGVNGSYYMMIMQVLMMELLQNRT
ncbi:MAG: hypothetical protein IPH57_07455 [Saprospiraceae bacterium]|nr:hypothetical protein [Saprospiraceae bacterium]